MIRPPFPPRPAAAALALALSAVPSGASPAQAQSAAPPATAEDACSPTVAAALDTWDAGMAAAERFGDRAVALAREKGRDYLLPLLGIDPKAVPQQDGAGTNGTTDQLGRAVEDSRNDPPKRRQLCIAVSRGLEDARGTAGAGLDALKRALEDWRLTPPPPAPTPSPTPSGPAPGAGGMIRT
ncbi:hypothetical protein [Azospirillum picis]|uniref:Uncharacterized protein n=1 Tax=Azospirillum picis TaxID=488438 RepID=A0ABU0MCL5_9PROT|nr:hypothetical protein [Azospirillum picis]MBP2297799.1 hypothetical protein [Azospirillum picis]MDQ0531178.1 hypothetical protein [Azospirillum picis]